MRFFFQIGNSYISVLDYVIPAKFGLLISIDLLKAAPSPDPKPEVKLHRCSRHFENGYDMITVPPVVLFE